MNPETYTVEQLRAMMTPGQRKLADQYVARLPAGTVIAKPDFMAALGLHAETAQAMIDEREVDAADWGGRGKQYWYITRESIISLIHKRILGLRAQVPTTLRTQERFDFMETTTTKGARA